jgi:endoglucanase
MTCCLEESSRPQWLTQLFAQLQTHMRQSLPRVVSLCFVLVTAAVAQISSVPPSHLAHLKHGINIGRFHDGFLENDSYKCCTIQDIARIKKIGFDHIRAIVKPGLMVDFSNPAAISGKSLDALDTLVRNCVSQHVGIILAVGLEEGRFVGKLDKDDDFVAKFADFWRALAKHYTASEYPSDSVFFEILNEPGLNEPGLTDKQWYGIQAKLADAIRESAKENTILATGAQKSDVFGLLALQAYHLGNVIYLFHYYEPYSFTHQGEDWNPNYAQFLKGGHVKYPYVSKSAKEAASQVPDLAERLDALHDMELSTKDRIEADIGAVAEWAKRRGVTVMSDEFGVIRTDVNPKDRAHWVKDVRTLLEKQEIGWTFWDYSSDSFGLVHTPNQFDKDVVRALGMKVPSIGR